MNTKRYNTIRSALRPNKWLKWPRHSNACKELENLVSTNSDPSVSSRSDRHVLPSPRKPMENSILELTHFSTLTHENGYRFH